MLIGALAELVTIGSVVPFISLLARPEMAADLPILQRAFSAAGWQDPDALVVPMTLSFLAIVVLATAVRLLLAYASNKLVFGIGHDISVRLYSTILDQPYAYHISRNSSELIGGITKAQLMLGTLLRPLMQGVVSFTAGLGIIVALLIVDAVTALSAGLVFVGLYWLIMGLFRNRLRQNSRTISSAQDSRIKAAQEGLGAIRDVILDANYAHYTRIFSREDRKLRGAQAVNAFLTQAPRFFVEMIGIGLIVGLAFTFTLRPGGLVGALPVLGALALGAVRLLPMIQQIYNAWASFSGNFGVLEDILALLNLPRQQRADMASTAIDFKHSIELQAIEFTYQSDLPPVIRDLSLRIPKGARIGIIGETGSGKSTLMDILMGLLEPSYGQFLVDGEPIRDSALRSWQSHIAHVPQHIYLTDSSIAENIALGEQPERIDMERVREAARQAQIAGFVESQRQGYKTRVGERGVQLSGGQRQRIGIARALYKLADVLVFDEASSALDMATETEVMKALDQLDHNLTVFIIAHRVQTLQNCDHLIKMEKGRVVSSGTYDQVVDGSVESRNLLPSAYQYT